MSYEKRLYDGVEYRVWTGARVHKSFKRSEDISLFVTPANVIKLVEQAAELHAAINFDKLIIQCPSGARFNEEQKFDAFAPYITGLSVEESCGRIDFRQFECLVRLSSIGVGVEKPRRLRLSAYPQLEYAGLGQVIESETIQGAQVLKELRLYKRLHIAKVGWEWLGTLPSLQTLWIVQSELRDLRGIPECGTVKEFSLGYPRGLISIDGIESFKGLKQLEIEGAKQLHDYMPIASLKELDYLGIFGSGEPDSLGFLDSLPLLKRAVIGNNEYTKIDGKFIRERM